MWCRLMSPCFIIKSRKGVFNIDLKVYSHFVIGTIRPIEDILQEQIFGFLEWWMYPIAQHSGICKCYQVHTALCHTATLASWDYHS